jgi:hypothetical protein
MKLNRKELLVPLVGVVIILGVAFLWPNPGLFAGPAVAPSTNFANDQAGPSYALGTQRVIQTTQGIVGEINTAPEFQNVTIQIQALSDKLGGYIQQEVLNYNNNEWNGNWLVNIPTNNATFALLELRNLIGANGQVTSIQVQINDVTNRTGGNASLVQWSPLSIALQQSNQMQQSPFEGALALLGTIGIDAGYFVLVTVPLYFGILAAVFVSRRGLAPLFMWVGKVSRPKSQEEKKINV